MPAFFYIKHRAQASDFRSFGRLLMGASFPKTPPKVRQGFVRKREKATRAAARQKTSPYAAHVEPERLLDTAPKLV